MGRLGPRMSWRWVAAGAAMPYTRDLHSTNSGSRLGMGGLAVRTAKTSPATPEPVINFPTGGAGSRFFSVPSFSQFRERGATNIGNLRARSDAEMGKTGPSPKASTPSPKAPGTPGCGENRAILRCRTRQWGRHSLRPPPRMTRFSLATPPRAKVNNRL